MTSRAGLNGYERDGLHDFADMQADGRGAAEGGSARSASRWEEGIREASGEDISVMLYTSGTTGRSKGVMIKAASAVEAARDTAAFDAWTSTTACLPICRWPGSATTTSTMRRAMSSGFCMNCPESSETVPQDLREIGPTFYFAPPRIFEALLTSVTIRMEDAGWLKRRLFDQFIGVARRHGEAILEGRPVPLSGRLAYALGNLLIYGPLKNVLGLSNIRVAYTAGEAIGQDLFSFFRSLGINLKQLYGQTEAFLYVTCRRTARCAPIRSARPRPMSTSASRMRARCSSARRACLPAISSRTKRPPKR